MKVLGHEPPSSRGDAMELREGYKSEFGVTCVDELEGLGNAVASYESALQCVEDPKRLHGLDRRRPVRGGLGIGDCELRELCAESAAFPSVTSRTRLHSTSLPIA